MAKGFKKGVSGNPKGKPKGTENKITKELKESLKCIISNEMEHIPELMESLTNKERLDIVCKMLPYVIPKNENVNITNANSELEQTARGFIESLKRETDIENKNSIDNNNKIQ